MSRPKIPIGWRKLRPGTAVKNFDCQYQSLGTWTQLLGWNMTQYPVGQYEMIIRRKRKEQP